MRAAHNNLKTRFAQRIRNEIRSRDHPRHRTDADEPDVLVLAKLDELRPRHRLGIAVDKDDFVFLRRQRLQKKHPQMRHEIPRDAVIGVVEQNFHSLDQARAEAKIARRVINTGEIVRFASRLK